LDAEDVTYMELAELVVTGSMLEVVDWTEEIVTGTLVASLLDELEGFETIVDTTRVDDGMLEVERPSALEVPTLDDGMGTVEKLTIMDVDAAELEAGVDAIRMLLEFDRMVLEVVLDDNVLEWSFADEVRVDGSSSQSYSGTSPPACLCWSNTGAASTAAVRPAAMKEVEKRIAL
jgi:hypothetical protein